MSLNSDGIIIILSSPSGAGKTTLVKLLSESRDFYTSISHTTRKPRNNEEEGKDYYFVNNDQFQNLIKNKEFLEYANVFSHLYGTTKTPVIKNLEMITRVFFNQRRKKIKNSFNQIFSDSKYFAEKLNLDLNLRPQNLSPSTYYLITKQYENLRS